MSALKCTANCWNRLKRILITKTQILMNNNWILTSEAPIEIGVEVIGFHPEWIHEDFNPNGTRLGFFQDGIDEPFFISVKWDNESDSYENDEELIPTHYMPMPRKPEASQEQVQDEYEAEIECHYAEQIGICDECGKEESLTQILDPETQEETGKKLCYDCCGNSGYCFGCGTFSAGTREYDLSEMGHYCDNCQDQIKSGNYEVEEDYEF